MSEPRDHHPTERFSDRVGDYERYRPDYPSAVMPWLLAESGLEAGAAVADLGAGTGLFSRDLLAAGLRVFAVEPNAPMRAAAVRALGHDPAFTAIDGRAEATGLPDHGVRLVTAAQAFHWFDGPSARAECRRILAPGCGVALIWNVRRLGGAFALAYEHLLREHCADYAAGMPSQGEPAQVGAFFGGADFHEACFDHVQRFDLAGLRGRLLSSSYTPGVDDPARVPLLAALAEVFSEHAVGGTVTFEYDTRVFFGRP